MDPALWHKEFADIRTYLEKYSSRLPPELLAELAAAESRLG